MEIETYNCGFDSNLCNNATKQQSKPYIIHKQLISVKFFIILNARDYTCVIFYCYSCTTTKNLVFVSQN